MATNNNAGADLRVCPKPDIRVSLAPRDNPFKEAILNKTHYGLNIYSHILRLYYLNEIVMRLTGREGVSKVLHTLICFFAVETGLCSYSGFKGLPGGSVPL
jgi:hypothetical protein